MRQFIYGLLGRRAGTVVLASWNRWWSRPLHRGGAGAVAIAAESLRSMQDAVHQLNIAIAAQTATLRQAEDNYLAQVRALKRFEQQAQLALKQGDRQAARLATERVLQIEQCLPRLKVTVETAEQGLRQSQLALVHHQEHLSTYRTEFDSVKALHDLNQALVAIARLTDDRDATSMAAQFESAKQAVEQRQHHLQALCELQDRDGNRSSHSLDKLVRNADVERRLLRYDERSESTGQAPTD